MTEYTYLRAWCRMMGSNHSYTINQVARAKQTNAPANAVYEKFGTSGPTGEWTTFDQVTSSATRAAIIRIVATEED